jgi:hydrogenase maturation protease
VAPARPLVICYGNRLLGDDAVAWHVAERLAEDPRLGGVDVVARHQLTPELAEDMSGASRVVFVDACVSSPPGAVRRSPVKVADWSASLRWSHELTPEALAGMTESLFGAVPPMDMVTVGGASYGVGEPLSTAAEMAVPTVVDEVAALVGASDRGDHRQAGRANQP